MTGFKNISKQASLCKEQQHCNQTFVIDVATLLLLWRIGQHVVAKFIFTWSNVLGQLIKVRATIKTCILCVDLREPSNSFNIGDRGDEDLRAKWQHRQLTP